MFHLHVKNTHLLQGTPCEVLIIWLQARINERELQKNNFSVMRQKLFQRKITDNEHPVCQCYKVHPGKHKLMNRCFVLVCFPCYLAHISSHLLQRTDFSETVTLLHYIASLPSKAFDGVVQYSTPIIKC